MMLIETAAEGSLPLSEGDEVTVGGIVGIEPDGCLIIDSTALQEELAVWKIGKTTTTAAGTVVTSMILVKQGSKGAHASPKYR